MLDLLAAHDARATFFVVGQEIAAREDILRRTVADGHEVGNHTWSHSRPATLTNGELTDELERTAAEIQRVTGVVPRLLRPPYGDEPERFRAHGETVRARVLPSGAAADGQGAGDAAPGAG